MRNRPQVGDHVVASHPVAVVLNRERFGVLVRMNPDFERLIRAQFGRVGHRLKTATIERIRSVRHEFAQKDVLARVERFRHQLKQFLSFRTKFKAFLSHDSLSHL